MNLFTGEHSTALINLDHVEFAESTGFQPPIVTVFFKSGRVKELSGQNASMFIKKWYELSKQNLTNS